MDTAIKSTGRGAPWNKGKLIGQKAPLKLKEIWPIYIRLQLAIELGTWPCSTLPSTANYATTRFGRIGRHA